MPYVTSWGQLARQEGRQEGIVQGAVEMLRQALEIGFGEIPAASLEKIQQCQDVDVLRALHKQALTAGSVDLERRYHQRQSVGLRPARHDSVSRATGRGRSTMGISSCEQRCRNCG